MGSGKAKRLQAGLGGGQQRTCLLHVNSSAAHTQAAQARCCSLKPLVPNLSLLPSRGYGQAQQRVPHSFVSTAAPQAGVGGIGFKPLQAVAKLCLQLLRPFQLARQPLVVLTAKDWTIKQQMVKSYSTALVLLARCISAVLHQDSCSGGAASTRSMHGKPLTVAAAPPAAGFAPKLQQAVRPAALTALGRC